MIRMERKAGSVCVNDVHCTPFPQGTSIRTPQDLHTYTETQNFCLGTDLTYLFEDWVLGHSYQGQSGEYFMAAFHGGLPLSYTKHMWTVGLPTNTPYMYAYK